LPVTLSLPGSFLDDFGDIPRVFGARQATPGLPGTNPGLPKAISGLPKIIFMIMKVGFMIMKIVPID
jgi:hypothetical protein